jgi:hypothetical protein
VAAPTLRLRWTAPLVALTALLAGAVTSRAADPPRPFTVGLNPSYAYVVLDKKARPKGGGAGLFLKYSISESFAVLATGLWTGHEIEGTEKTPGSLFQVVSAGVGLSYTLDLLSFSPSVDAAIGILYTRYQSKSATNFGVQFGIAADYYFHGWLGVGVAFHFHAFLSNPSDYPVYFDAGPRLSAKW